MSLTAAVAMAFALAAAPPAAGGPEGYRFDLERNFFASPREEVARRAEVESSVGQVLALTGGQPSGARLLQAFEAADRMERDFRRHDLYLFLRYAIDVRREDALADADRLRERVRTARRALRGELAGLDEAGFARLSAEAPGLARYHFAWKTARRDQAHALSPEAQAAVTALESATDASDYPRIANGLTFQAIEVGGKTLDVRRDQAEIDANPSAEVRREASRRLFAGYGAQRELFAYMLIRSGRAKQATARLRGYADAVEAAAAERYLTPAQVDAALAAIRRAAPAYKRWQAANERALTSSRHWSADEAVKAVVDSAAALGPGYRDELAGLLDPRNGRADLAASDNRLPMMGTASVYPIGTSAIYMGGYQGGLLDLIVIAHEGGHAAQAMLMSRAGVPMTYAAGPGYFTESFGRFQELLLLDHLLKGARSDAERAEIRAALAARLMAVFPSGEEAAVELAIMKAVGEGKARTADDLDRLSAEAGAPFSLAYEREPERKGLWMIQEGYFMDPLQELDDPYASLLAVRYFQLHRKDPADFRRRYLRLLANGYDAPPDRLLKQMMGIDLFAPGFAEETLVALEQEVAALYAPHP